MDPYKERRDIMDEDLLEVVSVVDVYDQAAEIGKEFEKLIEGHGVEAVTDLMPKVIKSLEQLELLASKYEKESSEINELRSMIEKLETEKNERAQERLRYEEELLQIEENWQRETRELVKSVSRLQDENQKLRANLVDTKEAVAEEIAEVTKKTEEKEIEVLTKLKDTVDKQREELRKHKRDMKQKIVDCEALQAQLDQIVKVNTELRRNNSIQRKQNHHLIEEKSDLEARLADKEQQITKITELIEEQEKKTEKVENVTAASNVMQSLPEDEVEVDDDHVIESADPLPQYPPGAPQGLTGEHGAHREEEGENMAHIEQTLSTVGKMVIDMKDPNRPRFTMNELRTVIMERNELKNKLHEVEEELTTYRPPFTGLVEKLNLPDLDF
ncbi:hypothetical protein FSP39_021516 [Pinctada imbricata]|uniref:RILP-like protein 1 n=1 Tax=Pinctada imbricata TaxID=66713 RepID=A0AA89BWA0_PINIB|nr:hypothetical protein FSP39_021516 [Pinctada imbricata]